MGSLPPKPPPPRLNFDRFGLPQDLATYMWVMYHMRVFDDSPARRMFLMRPSKELTPPIRFALQYDEA